MCLLWEWTPVCEDSSEPTGFREVDALTLSLRDTGVLFATAPQGSIDVTAVTSQELVMGVAADLLTGQAANMQAAGSVSVRTTQAPRYGFGCSYCGAGGPSSEGSGHCRLDRDQFTRNVCSKHTGDHTGDHNRHW